MSTRPPLDSIEATSAAGSAPEPPIGVAHPKEARPAVMENGRTRYEGQVQTAKGKKVAIELNADGTPYRK